MVISGNRLPVVAVGAILASVGYGGFLAVVAVGTILAGEESGGDLVAVAVGAALARAAEIVGVVGVGTR